MMRVEGVLICLCLLPASPAGWAAELSLETAIVRPGQVAVVALSFSSEGQPVSGIQFDIEWDAPLAITSLAGSQIGSSSKVLSTAALSSNAQRFLVTGMNAGPISDGELLRCFLSTTPILTAGTTQVRLTNVVAATPAGDAVSVRAGPALFSIGSTLSAASVPPASILNAASLTAGPICPGEIITILGGSELTASSFVLINGTAATTLYAGPGQINAVAPFGLNLTQSAAIEVRAPGRVVGAASVPVAPLAPAIFTQSGSGVGPGSILNQDYSTNSFGSPASADSIVMIYGAGFGAVNPVTADGQAAPVAAAMTSPVTASLGGVSAEVVYAGAAPGLIAGVSQVNVRIPKGLPANSATPIRLSIGGVATPPGVTIALQ
jgi:uncharacterized protein (TIGR03437 family)